MGRHTRDDARKVMFLKTTDGVAILGYAGLGATAQGTEPADWMSAVLRGRNLPLEQSLGILAAAMQEQFPRHMIQMPGNVGPAHHIIVPAFLREEPRLYSIDMVFAPDRKNYKFRYTRHITNTSPDVLPGTPRLGIGGSGALHLMQDKVWIRGLLRVVKANAKGDVSPTTVADHLAELNNDVHLGMTDKSVGLRCIVAWRFRKGGGGHRFYYGASRDKNSPSLPTIARGMDVEALVKTIMPTLAEMTEAMKSQRPPPVPDKDEINAKLARLPDKPDEKLR